MGKLKAVSILFLVIGIVLFSLMFIIPSFILFGFFSLFLYVIIIVFVYTIWALIDISRSQKPGNWKVMWTLIVLLLNIVGAIIYFLVGTKQKENEEWEEKLEKKIESLKGKRQR